MFRKLPRCSRRDNIVVLSGFSSKFDRALFNEDVCNDRVRYCQDEIEMIGFPAFPGDQCVQWFPAQYQLTSSCIICFDNSRVSFPRSLSFWLCWLLRHNRCVNGMRRMLPAQGALRWRIASVRQLQQTAGRMHLFTPRSEKVCAFKFHIYRY